MPISGRVILLFLVAIGTSFLSFHSLLAQNSLAKMTPQVSTRDRTVQFILVPNGSLATDAAAHMLSSILKKMSGVELDILHKDNVPGPAIHLGICNASNSDSVRWLKNQHESSRAGAVAIDVTEDGNVWIAGAHDWANWWAVGHFLHQEGFRWYLPHESAMEYPTNHSLKFSPRSTRHVSPFLFRGGPWQDDHMQNVQDWRALNGLWIAPDGGLVRSRYGTWPTILGNGHYEGQLLKAKDLLDFPERFAEVDGKRMLTHFELTDPHVRTDVSRNVLQQLLAQDRSENHFQGFLYGMNDVAGFSESRTAQQNGVVNEQVFRFVQNLADDVSKVRPSVKIHTLAYDGYPDPPQQTQLRDNVVVWATQWPTLGVVDLRSPSMDPNSANRKFPLLLQRWKQAAPGGVYVYTYWSDWKYFTPFPMVHNICEDIPAFAKQGVTGICCEAHAHWGTNALSLWAMTRMMWDPSQMESAIVDDFTHNYWGAAAEPMKRWEQELQSSFRENRGVDRGGMSPQMIELGRILFAQAKLKLKEAPPRFRWRFELAKFGFDQSVRWYELAKELDNLRDRSWQPSADFTTIVRERQIIVRRFDEIQAAAATEKGRWAFRKPIVDLLATRLEQQNAIDPRRLPSGKSTFLETFEHGGWCRLTAKTVEGFLPSQSGRGIGLPAGKKGRLEFVLKPADPKDIFRSLTCTLRARTPHRGKDEPADVGLRVTVSSPGRERTLSNGIDLQDRMFSLDNIAVGLEEVRISFEARTGRTSMPEILERVEFDCEIASAR